VIESFGDGATKDIFLVRDSKDARSIPNSIWPIVRRKLAMIDAAASVGDLRIPPGNRLEQLKGVRVGFWSIRVNDQYRLTFRFQDGSALEVTCEDYH
jgi:proteic killer suppression protein